MKKTRRKLLCLGMAVCTVFSLSAGRVQGAPGEAYTYTVTFYAGDKAEFANTQGLSVNNRETASSYSIEQERGEIRVTGLKSGDVVSFDAQAGAVSMGEDSKYYVRGIRLSGRDNNTAEASAFRVTGDADYVVAYGIKGNMVSYRVNYQDAQGNELAPSRTYYGNVGDKPVVAHVYVENYTPQALALTKTLSENQAENVFTFAYTEIPREIITQPGETTTTVVTETVPGTDTGDTGTAGTGNTGAGNAETEAAGTGETGNAGAGAAGTGGTGNAGAGTAGTADTGAAGDGAGEAAGAEGTETIAPEDVPQGNQDLVDLDEEETPLGNLDIDKEEVKKGLPLAAGIAIGIAAAAALGVLAFFVRKHRR